MSVPEIQRANLGNTVLQVGGKSNPSSKDGEGIETEGRKLFVKRVGRVQHHTRYYSAKAFPTPMVQTDHVHTARVKYFSVLNHSEAYTDYRSVEGENAY